MMNADTQIFRPSGPETDISLHEVPGIPRLFATLLALSLVRPSRLPDNTQLDDIRMHFDNFRMDPSVVRGFSEVCGYAPSLKQVPAPYIQTLFIGIISRFISSSHFPINPMGLIQVGQSFAVRRPVSPDERLDLSCRLLDMTQTPRGISTRFDMTAFSDGDEVWQGVATYFTRAKNPPPKDKSAGSEDSPLEIRETIAVPANTGRRYAAVSRDYNPHHLYPWTARLIGFKQAIAHGIWSLARTCASLEKAFGYPEQLEMDGALKLPIFLPATVTLGYDTLGPETAFELRDQVKGLPHLKGTFRI